MSEDEDFFVEDEDPIKIEQAWNRPGKKGRTVKPSQRRPLDIEKYKTERAAFEQKYGTPSWRMEEVFTQDGVLHETPDFIRWHFIHTMLVRRGHR